ncbi:MAG: hypothetical protein ISS92_06130 [Candidatus Omnitrophica bacterium]|nr:hypothetical protein [Candidatus Omnitrophota bacterium]
MIVKMKKIAVIAQAKDAGKAVGDLRSLGILHVEHQKAPLGKDITSLNEDAALLDNIINILSMPEYADKKILAKQAGELKDWRFAAKHILDSQKRFEQLDHYAKGLKTIENQWESWGDFDPESIKRLEKKGIHVKLYLLPEKAFRAIKKEDFILKVVSKKNGMINCAFLSRSESAALAYPELGLPKISLGKVRSRLAEDQKAKTKIENDIKQHLTYKERFLKIKEAFKKELELHEAIQGMGEVRTLSYITGYVPHDATERVLAMCKEKKLAAFINDPSEDDNIPTLIRNPRWLSVINPVFKFIEIVPGYKELDISFWFLIFFSIFFGMLVGDAGIGMIFILLTAIAQIKLGRKVKDKSIFPLFYVLSLTAVIWGALTGTCFGQAWLTPYFKPLAPALRSDKNIQALCFLIGAIHLSIGHSWRALIKLPSLQALADIGWVVILWGGFFLAKTLVLGEALPFFVKWFFLIGSILVIVFTSPSWNILKSVPKGLGKLLLNIVNSFTDIVSYVRLFAVGLASVAVADAFNQMAIGIGYKSAINAIIAVIVILIGQGLNLVLGPIAVLVHGIRLNVLEFCNHIDIKWTGFMYKPLQKERT